MKLKDVLKKYQGILLLLLIGVIIYIIIRSKKIKPYWNVFFAKSLVASSFVPSPVLPEDKKTISYILHMYPPEHNAGAEWMVHCLNRYLIQEAGYKVNVILPSFPHKEFEGVKLYTFSQTKEIEDVLRHSSVILSHLDYQVHAVKTAAIVKRPIVLFMHNHSQNNYLKKYRSFISSYNVHLIHNSQWISRVYNHHKYDSVVLYPPVNWKDYQVQTSRRYVSLINVNKNKGGDLLVEIAKQMPDVEFLAVKGGYGDQVVDTSVQNIKYINHTDKIKEIYAQSGIVLMPSREESWGRVAIEAMSSGIPVIANPTPGLKEACGPAGIFLSREKPEEWVSMIYKLRENPELYNKYKNASLKRAKQLEPTPQLREVAEWLQGLEWNLTL